MLFSTVTPVQVRVSFWGSPARFIGLAGAEFDISGRGSQQIVQLGKRLPAEGRTGRGGRAAGQP